MGRHHLEVDRVDAVLGESRRDRAKEGVGHPGAALRGYDVQIRDAPDPCAPAPGE
jgi:hypothetical protein